MSVWTPSPGKQIYYFSEISTSTTVVFVAFIFFPCGFTQSFSVPVVFFLLIYLISIRTWNQYLQFYLVPVFYSWFVMQAFAGVN
jgi:hypothetical protein